MASSNAWMTASAYLVDLSQRLWRKHGKGGAQADKLGDDCIPHCRRAQLHSTQSLSVAFILTDIG